MQIIGHRGASGYKPENTLASFQKAIALGVDMIELDVYSIKTGEVVVHHDKKVDRTTDGTGNISEFTLDQLRQLDAGNGQTIPLLSEVLDLLDKRIPVNIEMKGKDIAQPVADMIEQYVSEKNWSDSMFLVSAFDHDELKRFAELRPSVRVGALYRWRPLRFRRLIKGDNAYSANFNATFITSKNVRDAHAHGLKAFAYTVNNRRDADRMRALKVDGIFTNFPDKVV